MGADFIKKLRIILNVEGEKQANKALIDVLRPKTQLSKGQIELDKGLRKAEKERNDVIAEGFAKRARLNKAAFKEKKKRQKLTRALEVKGVSKGTMAGMDIKKLDKFNHKLNVVGKQARKFKMHWLGIMFAGMAVDRVMSKLIKGMITDYKELTKESMTPLSKSLTALEANWKFLKFAIMDAASPFLTTLIDGIGGFIRFLSGQDPKVLQGIAIGILAISAAAKVMMVGGQFALAVGSISALFADNKLTNMTKGNTQLTNMATSLEKLAGIGAIVVSFKVATDAFKAFKEGQVWEGLFSAAGAGLLAAGGYKLIKGIKTGLGGGWMIVLGFALDALAKNNLGKQVAGLLGIFTSFGSSIAAIFEKAAAHMIAVTGGELTVRQQALREGTFAEAAMFGYSEGYQQMMKIGEAFDEFTENLTDSDNSITIRMAEITKERKEQVREMEKGAGFAKEEKKLFAEIKDIIGVVGMPTGIIHGITTWMTKTVGLIGPADESSGLKAITNQTSLQLSNIKAINTELETMANNISTMPSISESSTLGTSESSSNNNGIPGITDLV